MSASATISLPENPREVAVYFTSAGSRFEVEQRDNDTHVIKKVPVFKSGTFKDSLGQQNTWTSEHLAQMAFNFNMLRERGNFANVPIRADHSFSVKSVVGYFADLTTDGDFLYADLEITEPDAYAKWERGTFRGRSLEVGFYETNDEELFWPVVLGVAFVDIPAVEGLHSKYGKNVTVIEEITVPTENTGESTDWTAAFYAQGVADARANFAPSAPAPATFRVNGQDVTDAAAVQSHITALETYRTESIAAGRRGFVSALAEDNKIAATQVEPLTELALDMADEQFEKFKASYEGAPALGLLAEHGNAVTNPEGEGAPEDDALAVAEAIVADHRRSGMSEELIAKTPSFQKLQAHKTASASA